MNKIIVTPSRLELIERSNAHHRVRANERHEKHVPKQDVAEFSRLKVQFTEGGQGAKLAIAMDFSQLLVTDGNEFIAHVAARSDNFGVRSLLADSPAFILDLQTSDGTTVKQVLFPTSSIPLRVEQKFGAAARIRASEGI